MTNPRKKPVLNYTAIVLTGILILGIFFAGCTRSAGTSPVTATVPIPSPSPIETVTVATTNTPEPVVTIIRYISQTKDIKDSELLFALQVPVEWNVSTYRVINPDNSDGLMYRTDLLGDDKFLIRTYAITRSQDQAFRDEFRAWSPTPLETTVKINDITCDRFESLSDGKINVAYVVRKSSANERGYASVLFFSANATSLFEKEDFEKIVSSFRYFTGTSAGTIPGEEIPRIALPVDSSGRAMSSKGSGGDSGGSSSGGCRCCRG